MKSPLHESKLQILKMGKIPDPNITKPMLTQDDKINIELFMKIMTEKKTTLLFPRNQHWLKNKGRNQKSQ